MKGKRLLCIGLSSVMLMGAGALAACGGTDGPGGDGGLSSKDLPATTSVIGIEDYRDKVKGGVAGTMAGVAYGYRDFVKGQKWEFSSKDWIDERSLPSWETNTVSNGYDQDDVYLAMTAIEAFRDLGLDATSKELGIYMYNKNFQFWTGSNSDVLERGFAPPFSGYPKQSSGYYTNAYSDGNSYQCGASFGGYLGLNMTGFANDLVQKVAEICTYGDGIYSTQFISAMYGAAFFTDSIPEIVSAGLAAIPADSWSALMIEDVLANKQAGKTAEENFKAIKEKWIEDPEYNWTAWPNGDNVTPGSGMLLDGKACSAFTVIGLLYGEGDLEKSTKITMQCANDCDSTAAATAGIISVISGWKGLDSGIKGKIIDDQYFKYTRSTVDGIADTCVELVKEAVVKQGGQVAKVDGVESLVIPAEAKTAQIEDYKNSKNPPKMEIVKYTDEEMARMRYIAEPGFETCSNDGKAGAVGNGWVSSKSQKTVIECMEQTAYTGLCNVKMTAVKGDTVTLYNTTTRSLRKNTNYTLSCMVQAGKGFASELSLAVWDVNGNALRTSACEVKEGWYQVTLNFNSGNNTMVRVGVQLKGANDSDFVRLDDFELRVK